MNGRIEKINGHAGIINSDIGVPEVAEHVQFLSSASHGQSHGS